VNGSRYRRDVTDLSLTSRVSRGTRGEREIAAGISSYPVIKGNDNNSRTLVFQSTAIVANENLERC